jgi:hypothetical protein
MAIDFNALLTDEHRRNLLQQRIEQVAGVAYQHELNRQIAEKIKDPDSVETSLAALVTLETAIMVHQEELDLLG